MTTATPGSAVQQGRLESVGRGLDIAGGCGPEDIDESIGRRGAGTDRSSDRPLPADRQPDRALRSPGVLERRTLDQLLQMTRQVGRIGPPIEFRMAKVKEIQRDAGRDIGQRIGFAIAP